MKTLVGTFNQEKALVEAFSVIVKTDYETDGQVFSRSGHYVPPDRRLGVTTLYRGCFVLDILKVDTQDTGVSTRITSTQSYILTICCTNMIIHKT